MKKNLLVQIAVKLNNVPDGKLFRIGTGYPIAGGRILTAGHVIEDATEDKIEVSWYHQPDRGWKSCKAILWNGLPEFDAAILQVDCPEGIDTEYGIVSESEPKTHEKWESEGFAKVGTRDEKPTPFKGGAYSRGPGSEYFELGIDNPTTLQNGWAGASGSPVFVNEKILGLIVRCPDDYRNGKFEALSIARLLTAEGFRKEAELPKAIKTYRFSLLEYGMPVGLVALSIGLLGELYVGFNICSVAWDAQILYEQRIREIDDLGKSYGLRRENFQRIYDKSICEQLEADGLLTDDLFQDTPNGSQEWQSQSRRLLESASAGFDSMGSYRDARIQKGICAFLLAKIDRSESQNEPAVANCELAADIFKIESAKNLDSEHCQRWELKAKLLLYATFCHTEKQKEGLWKLNNILTGQEDDLLYREYCLELAERIEREIADPAERKLVYDRELALGKEIVKHDREIAPLGDGEVFASVAEFLIPSPKLGILEYGPYLDRLIDCLKSAESRYQLHGESDPLKAENLVAVRMTLATALQLSAKSETGPKLKEKHRLAANTIRLLLEDLELSLKDLPPWESNMRSVIETNINYWKIRRAYHRAFTESFSRTRNDIGTITSSLVAGLNQKLLSRKYKATIDELRYNMACIYSLSVVHGLSEDDNMSNPELGNDCRNMAMDWLETIEDLEEFRLEFDREPGDLDGDTDIDALRSLDRFKRLRNKADGN